MLFVQSGYSGIPLPAAETSALTRKRQSLPRTRLGAEDGHVDAVPAFVSFFKFRLRLTGQDAIDLKLPRPRDCFGRDIQA